MRVFACGFRSSQPRPVRAEKEQAEVQEEVSDKVIVREANIPGGSVKVFDDGSIELQTAAGTKRFRSLRNLSVRYAGVMAFSHAKARRARKLGGQEPLPLRRNDRAAANAHPVELFNCGTLFADAAAMTVERLPGASKSLTQMGSRSPTSMLVITIMTRAQQECSPWMRRGGSRATSPASANLPSVLRCH